MLSILIAVYNFDVRLLVADLSRQASDCNIPFEILCIDDASDPTFREINKVIKGLPGVYYTELEENVGRSRIRNMLAEKARYEYLLFMDCDSQTNTDEFIRLYTEQLKPGAVIYGGRNYSLETPQDPSLYLRWFYGLKRETIPVDIRKRDPYKSFMTNNFLIPKAVFMDIKMDESIQGYGHEDTVLGLDLKTRNIPIIHIDNPLLHVGLEPFDEFLQKTENGVKNLYQLIKSGKVDNNIKLYRYYRYLKNMGMGPMVLKRFRSQKTKVLQNLRSSQPNLRQFDFYKLGCLFELDALDQTD